MNYTALAQMIKGHRQYHGLNQTEFAAEAGISRNYLSMIEIGKAQNLSIEIMARLASAMNVKAVHLLKILLDEQGNP